MEDIVYFALFVIENLALLPIFRSVKAWRDGEISESYMLSTIRICVSIQSACLWAVGVITLLDPAVDGLMSFAVLGTATAMTFALAGLLKGRKVSTSVSRDARGFSVSKDFSVTKDARGLEGHQVIHVR